MKKQMAFSANDNGRYRSNTPVTTRRQLLAQVAIGAMASLSVHGARAGMPIPKPLTLEEELKYHARWIFTGRLRRVVYLSPATAKKLFTPGMQIDPMELKVYERHELEKVDSAYLEIVDALPVLMKADVPTRELAELTFGTVYCNVSIPSMNPELDAYITALTGKPVVLLIEGQRKRFGVAATSFPNPIYDLAGGANWRDGLPLPIEDLPKVAAIAQKLGFVKPTQPNR
jgi:hypothetical protein